MSPKRFWLAHWCLVYILRQQIILNYHIVHKLSISVWTSYHFVLIEIGSRWHPKSGYDLPIVSTYPNQWYSVISFWVSSSTHGDRILQISRQTLTWDLDNEDELGKWSSSVKSGWRWGWGGRDIFIYKNRFGVYSTDLVCQFHCTMCVFNYFVILGSSFVILVFTSMSENTVSVPSPNTPPTLTISSNSTSRTHDQRDIFYQ